LRMNRRQFVRGSLAVAATAYSAGAARLIRGQTSSGSGGKFVRLGGPIFAKTDDPEELARAHVKLGYRAAYCPNVSLADPARIAAVADAFKKHDVVIAEVGRWVNLLDSKPEARQANIKSP